MRVLFFFNDTATTEIYPLSLHDALPILPVADRPHPHRREIDDDRRNDPGVVRPTERIEHHREVGAERSEEHTSELQSRQYLVCRLLLEKNIISSRDAASAAVRTIEPYAT